MIGSNNPMFGKNHKVTQYTRDKISKANKGRKRIDNIERNLLLFSGKRKEMLSCELKKKISDSNKGKKRSMDTCRKISVSRQGTLRLEQTKKKISEYQKGKIRSLETRKKMAEYAKSKTKILVTCIGCGKTTHLIAFNRWHKENCKTNKYRYETI